MRFKARIATTGKNKLGFSESKEMLETFAKQINSTSRPSLCDGHDDTKILGNVLNAEVIWDEAINEHSLMVELDLPDDTPPEQIEKLASGGLSMSYTDGGHSYGPEVKGQGITFLYDAYSTDEKDLAKNANLLSKELNTQVSILRLRQHGLGIPTYVGVKILEHLLDKFLDDIQLYEKIKKFLINTSQTTSDGKIAEIAFPEKRVRFRYEASTDDELNKLMDQHRNFMKEKTAINEPGTTFSIYTITKTGVELKKMPNAGGIIDTVA